MAKASRRKGKDAEREVARIFRHYGYEKAAPTPGSGGLRPYGAGDLSPFPGDLFGCEPFLVEVKRDERAGSPSHGWTGEAFVRATLKDLSKLATRHNAVVGGSLVVPILVVRASYDPWTFYAPERSLRVFLGMSAGGSADAWVGLSEAEFFYGMGSFT